MGISFLIKSQKDTIGQRRKVIAYCWVDGKSPRLAKVEQACQNMIMGLTLSIYTKRTFLMDGIK